MQTAQEGDLPGMERFVMDQLLYEIVRGLALGLRLKQRFVPQSDGGIAERLPRLLVLPDRSLPIVVRER